MHRISNSWILTGSYGRYLPVYLNVLFFCIIQSSIYQIYTKFILNTYFEVMCFEYVTHDTKKDVIDSQKWSNIGQKANFVIFFFHKFFHDEQYNPPREKTPPAKWIVQQYLNQQSEFLDYSEENRYGGDMYEHLDVIKKNHFFHIIFVFVYFAY